MKFKSITFVIVITAVLNACEQGGISLSGQSTPSTEFLTSKWPFSRDNGNQGVAQNLLAPNIYIVLDGSGSMTETGCSGSETKINAAKRALFEFVKAVPANANIGMLAFDRQGTSERVALSGVAGEKINKQIESVAASGGTPLRSAIDIAYKSLTLQAQKQLGYGEYHLVIVTDGAASRGYEPDDLLNIILKESPIIVHTIGFCIDENHSLNQPGRTVYNTAQDYESLRAGLKSVLAESPEFSVSQFN